MFHRTQLMIVVCAVLGLVGCNGGSPGDTESNIPSFEDFVTGKADSAYIGTKAAEIEGELTSRVFLDLSGLSAEDRANTIAQANADPKSIFWEATTNQIKYSRNKLKAQKLDLNLEGGDQVFSAVTQEGTGLWASYSVKIDSLVKYKDLEAQGLTPEDLVGRTYDLLLPVSPDRIFQQGGIACATDPDGDPVTAADLNESNYFYYYDPDKAGCPLQKDRELVAAPFEIHSSADAPTVWPEYDQLVADGKISWVVLFGQIEHGDLSDEDWGWYGYENYQLKLRSSKFVKTADLPDGLGAHYEKTYSGGLQVSVDMYNPTALADHRDRALVDELFSKALHDYELVYYAGHSFYGSLKVLDKPESFPVDTYQIVFMDSCWSYAYYTKQVFTSKSRESDPTGMKYTDVLNNTEMGNTGSEMTSLDMWLNVLKGANLAFSGKKPTSYSWNNLVKYMNLSAEERAAEDNGTPEIYGVSGVRDNCYTPTGNRC